MRPAEGEQMASPVVAAAQPRPVGPRRRSRRVKVGRALGLVGLAVVAGLIHPRALAAAAPVAAVLLTGFLYPWLGARGVRASWAYPVRRGQVGRPLAVRVTLRSVSPWPVLGLVARGGWADPTGPADDPVTAAVPHVPALGVREVTLAVVPTRRGVYPIHPPTLSSGFPFGLREVRRPAEAVGQVVVWPEVVPLATGTRDAGGVEPGMLAARPGRPGHHHGEFAGTRPYRAGEPLSRIHWKQSARHDQLIGWETAAAARRAVALVVETAPGVHARHAGGDSLERALSVGASLAGELAEAGVHVTLAFEPGRGYGVGSRRQLAAALDAMARFDGTRGADLDALLAGLPRRAAGGGAACVVTTVAGWRRAGDPARARRRFVVVDERGPGEAAGRPPGLPREVPLVPLADPGHRHLVDAWREVAGGRYGLG